MKHSASLLIQDSSGDYLTIQRSHACKNFQEWWEFPGGKIDDGESPAQGLVREVREECGIEAVIADPETACMIGVPDGVVDYAFFAWQCPHPRPEVRVSEEHQAFQWLPFSELRKLRLMEPHRKYLERYWHRQQIAAYLLELPYYQIYSKALDRVLRKACALSIPEAVVQARPKSVSSFAEKCVRKIDEYPDPVHQFTDLCGGRMIVQTLEQVKAVRLFIEHNFHKVECDDKGDLLSEKEFGYRDVHYLVRLKKEQAKFLEQQAETASGEERIGKFCAGNCMFTTGRDRRCHRRPALRALGRRPGQLVETTEEHEAAG